MRLLIIGASGYLGRELWQRANEAGHRVTGTSFRSIRDDLIRLDVRDRAAVDRLRARVRPDVVINTASLQSDWETTAVGPANLAGSCAERRTRFIHLSSDAVFDGSTARYDEGHSPSPATAYGAAKAAAEVAVAALHPAAAIVRTSWILGDGDSWFERLVTTLATGQTGGALFDDDIRCPVHVADLAGALLELCDSEFAGPLHAAGSDAVSRYDLGLLLAARDGLDPGRLPRARKAAIGAPGSAVRLDSRRAAGLLRTELRGARAFTGVG